MNVALYCRMSTDKQEHSVKNQIDVLNEYAERNKMFIANTYTDEGISGRTAENRPAFMRMIDDSGKGMFEAVLIYDSSRFARNLKESLIYKSILQENRVQLISITEPNLDDETSVLTDALLGAMNEMYSRKLSKNVKRGMIFQSQLGQFQVPPPYGYHKKNKVISIVEHEAGFVRLVFEMFLETPAWHTIAVRANDMGYRMRKGAKWGSRDIKRMLFNPAYIGYVNYNGEIYKGNHEPILPIQLWESVQDAIKNKPIRYRARPESSVKHWLSGVLKCGECGSSMSYGERKNRSCMFRCHANNNGKCKVANYISVGIMEKVFFDILHNVAAAEVTDLDIETVSRQSVRSDIAALETTLKKAISRLERHKEAYSAGIDTLAEYRVNKEKCQIEIDALQRKISAVKDGAPTYEKLGFLQSQITDLTILLKRDDLSIQEKNFAVKSIIQKIVVDRKADAFTVFYFL